MAVENGCSRLQAEDERLVKEIQETSVLYRQKHIRMWGRRDEIEHLVRLETNQDAMNAMLKRVK